MGKDDDSRRTKKISSKKQGKKLGESNKLKQHKHQWSNDACKKNSNVKEIRLPIKKTKQTLFIVSFIMILYGFLWILNKNKQKEGNFIVQKQVD